jgi:imidazole glycerol-phosphate synthase subunit HisF
MKSIRIIPRLDVKGSNLVKGIHMEGLRVLGLPERFSNNYFLDGADELIYIDMVASLYGRENLRKIVKRAAENIFIPLTVGGGVRSIDDIRQLLRAGADKVAINTAVVNRPELITEAAKVFGSQCIVVSIQAMKKSNGRYEAYTDNGREPSGKDVIEWAIQAAEYGAGEILITSIDQEGTGGGYDIDLISAIVEAVPIPVIACGGAGNKEHVEELIRNCAVDAVSAASIFHYNVITKLGVEKRDEGNIEYLEKFIRSGSSILKRLEPISVSDLKSYLVNTGINCINPRLLSDKSISREGIENVQWGKADEKTPFVVVVDYGRSNLFSVEWALKTIGARVEISSDPEQIINADKLIIAGVGAFGHGMEDLYEKGLVDSIIRFAESGKPMLGICLGMQLFMSESEEFGLHQGLDLISGKVVRLSEYKENYERVKIPHIGWNQISPYPSDEKTTGNHKNGKWSDYSILNDCEPYDNVYFVHSYIVKPDDPGSIVAETVYGPNRFCSVIMKKNIVGCQFHPEKSGSVGLNILRRFTFDFQNDQVCLTRRDTTCEIPTGVCS